jgi:type IV secretory pathway VirB2 component (pilin)
VNWHWKTIATVWLLATVGAILTGVFATDDSAIGWIGLTLAVCTLVTLGLQIATGSKEGYVKRVTLSVAGAIVILVAATIVVSL